MGRQGGVEVEGCPPDYTAGEERAEGASITIIKTVLWLSARLL